jgi:hypothetical protein
MGRDRVGDLSIEERESRPIIRTEVICVRCDDLNMNLTGSGYDPVTVSCECGYEHLNISRNSFYFMIYGLCRFIGTVTWPDGTSFIIAQLNSSR